MGCNSSRKNLQEKSSLNSKELEKCNEKFKKLSSIAPGKAEQFIAIEGFRTAFTENTQLADKIFKFIKSQSETNNVNRETFVLSMELFTKQKSEIYVFTNNYKHLEQYQLLLLISIQHPEIYKREEFKLQLLTKVEITYLQAGIFIKEIINMLSPKGNRLSDDDDVAAKLLINNIFGGNINENYPIDKTSNMESPIVLQIKQKWKRYFAGKFTDSSHKIKLPELTDNSLIINYQILGLFYLSTPWFYQTKKNLNLLFAYQEGQDQFDLNLLSNQLLSQNSPTLLLFRHVERLNKYEKLPYQHTPDENLEAFEQHYLFGYFNSSRWRLAPDITGDKNSSIFSIVPKYQQFITGKGKGQSKYALLNSDQGRPLPQSLQKKLSKFGLGIGGSGYEQHRIWIDGQNLKDSYITDDDKTFATGHILAPHITKLNIDRIEVWSVEFISTQQDLSHFRQTQMNHINQLLEDEIPKQNVDPGSLINSIKNRNSRIQSAIHTQQVEEEKYQQ
ncbi:unnamed protein product (macronuclear) [Paramecium tetraurelia]|uniref:Oxidation resistance protein 1 n=1 Tax=Paramecium tetraurelia TaxID=5888 RepID=A0BPF1_PARTE|nr:uncharacterized protein GSPATT00005167001 [Paramecium tetraurelia]CAK60418.1 unnamed protein product [Paramecium tetraurelia]|eukprot:XP_001427816.1 hypothetical protein (macronuclear) [Paramecium tetraurelia strain d4-2]